MKTTQVPTPFLRVDLDALERNIARMAAYLEGHDAALRPHFKAHKTLAIAARQQSAGCIGFTCATVSEAEVLAEAGYRDILIANQVLDAAKVDRVAALAKRCDLTVAFDSPEGVALLADSGAGALVDVNVGMPRCGAPPERVGELVRAIASTSLRFRGVMGYEGHAVLVEDRGEREGKAVPAMDVLLQVTADLRSGGFEVEIVSGGGTGTYDMTGIRPGVTELQAGSYALMDTAYAKVGVPFEETLRCVCTVVSRNGRLCVLDAGLKTLTIDHGNPLLEDGVAARVLYCADEHTTLVAEEGLEARPGDRMMLRPSHVDPTVNIHDHLYACRGDDVVEVWPVEARGYRVPSSG